MESFHKLQVNYSLKQVALVKKHKKTAVAEAECNTVTGLKQVHHAATPLPLS